MIFDFSDSFLIFKWSFDIFRNFSFKISQDFGIFFVYEFFIFFASFFMFFKKLYKIFLSDLSLETFELTMNKAIN